MIVGGFLLFPDDLGRAFGAGLVLGGGLLGAGAFFVRDAAVKEAARAAAAAAGSDAAVAMATLATAPGPAQLEPAPAKPARAAKPAKPARPARRAGKRGARTECPWCSAVIPADSETCPGCGAAVAGPAAAETPIPGLTEVSPELRVYALRAALPPQRGFLADLLGEPDPRLEGPAPEPVDHAVVQPPDARVRAEMARLDQELAAAAAAEETGSLPPQPTAGGPDEPTPGAAVPPAE
jgi:hypothetical protein